jgi:hypothetical protein
MGRNRSNATAPAVKGNLVAGTGTDTSGLLTVGANDTVLTADSSTATGLKWAAPAGGSFTLLSTTTLSGTETSITGINQGYLHLFITVEKVVMNSATSEFIFQLSGNGNQACIRVSNAAWGNTTGGIIIFNQGLNATPENRSAAGIWVYNYASTTAAKAILAAGGNHATNGDQRGFVTGGVQADIETAVSQVLFRPGTNSMNSGTVRIYGVK